MTKVRRTVTLPSEDIEKKVETRRVNLGFRTFNQYFNYLVNKDMQEVGAETPKDDEKKSLTPQEQITKLGEEIGRIRDMLGPKYDVLHFIAVVELNDPNPKDLNAAGKRIWEYITDRYCRVQFQKSDVEAFKKFGSKPFTFEKLDLDRFIQQAQKKRQIKELKTQLTKES